MLGCSNRKEPAFSIQGMLQVAEKQPDLVPELAEFFMAHGDFKSSQQLLALAQGKQPATDRFLVDLARTQAVTGAAKRPENVMEVHSGTRAGILDALVATGTVMLRQSDWAAATEAFSLAAKLAPDRPDILYGLVSARLFFANQMRARLSTLKSFHSLVPNDLRSTYLLALALFGVKKWEEAKPFAEQVLGAHPDDREMNLLLADIAFNDDH